MSRKTKRERNERAKAHFNRHKKKVRAQRRRAALRQQRKPQPITVYHADGKVESVSPGYFQGQGHKLTGRSYWYIYTDHWKEVRVQAKIRDGWGCSRCGKLGARLEVHHLHYDNVGKELLDDVITVCQPCHAIVDRLRRKAGQQAKRYRFGLTSKRY